MKKQEWEEVAIRKLFFQWKFFNESPLLPPPPLK
jgi:hypothetical protein